MFDIKAWLINDMRMSEADATATAAKMKPEGTAKLERTQTRALEYDAKEADIVTARQELKDANDKLNLEMVEWANLTAQEKAQVPGLQKQIEDSRIRTAQLEHRLTTLATETGRDPKTLLEGVTPPAKVEEKKVEPIDTSKFVDNDRHAASLIFALELPAQLQYIADQHHALTGERLDTRDIVKEIRTRAGQKNAVVDPVAIWEEKYGIPAKREAAATKKYEDDIKAAEARGEERARTNVSVPGATPPGRHSPAFGVRNGEGVVTPRTSALQRPQPGTIVRNAASALATGKYRQSGR